MEQLLAQLSEFKSHSKLNFKFDNDKIPENCLIYNSESIVDSTAQNFDWFDSKVTELAQQSDFSGSELSNMIISALEAQTSMEETQSAIVDMVGFENLDFAAEILANREDIINSKQSGGLTGLALQEWKRKNRLEGELKARKLKMIDSSSLLRPEDGNFPHVYRKKPASNIQMVNTKRVLPSGTIRESLPLYERVVIPAGGSSDEAMPKEVLIKIKDMDEMCQVTFSKYKTLNPVQSLVYPVGYESNENMLICAPTGAGKTDIALLALLRAIQQGKESGKPWKAVYVAPLKALAAEITEKMGSRLAWMNIKVRELTGDMQLTRAEIDETDILVTTPEKWDVVTRKPDDDSGLATQIQLLIIDEVHLLHEDRGAVIESLVSRTRRQVEAQQRPIRIIGLSATLPNFLDVAQFLGVNPQRALFFFDNRFRPVPLEQQFFGVRPPKSSGGNSRMALAKSLDSVAYEQCVEHLKKGVSVMVFVHSRRDTFKTAKAFGELARNDGYQDLFIGENAKKFDREMSKFNNRNMQEMYQMGFAAHNAGMSRQERNLSERLFGDGGVRVLFTTATLAWGVNLPAAVVIIKGTDVYDAQKGGFVDLGISDVIQIFGRAGRPQYKQTGTGILCTSAERMDHYLDAITNQNPIESRFSKQLPEHLNAEISLGSVSTVSEAVQWLGYTYLYVRMLRSPQVYGLLPRDLEDDPQLINFRRKLVLDAVRKLRDAQMIVFSEDDEGESLIAKNIGRIASEFYLPVSAVELFHKKIGHLSTEAQFIQVMSASSDFEGMKVRNEETKELEAFAEQLPFPVDLSTGSGKAALLLQGYIVHAMFKESALNSDMAYVAQNAARVLRAFFLLCLSRGWASAALACLDLDKSVHQQSWPDAAHPLLQLGNVPSSVAKYLMQRNNRTEYGIEELKTMSTKELGDLVHNQGWGPRIYQLVAKFPLPSILVARAHPLTTSVARISVEVALLAPFKFDKSMHLGSALNFWIMVYAPDLDSQLVFSDKIMFPGRSATEPIHRDFAVPSSADVKQLVIKLVSDTFLGAESTVAVDVGNLKAPEQQTIRTPLLKLRPLPVKALHNPNAEAFYSKKFQHFNPMQTMTFHSLYYNDFPVLIGSPTGSGKTIACEIAVLAALRDHPKMKIVYVAPMKALVRERVDDWKTGICTANLLPGHRRPKLVELTGDSQPTSKEVREANLVVTTPEKFDGISRHSHWATNEVSLVILDEVHLLASDRGAILEAFVSRLNRTAGYKPRLLGLSTAVANAGDLAAWLGIKTPAGVFNFPSSVRPVPLQMYIDGFPEVRGFSPFMKSMNKPTYMAIKRHSPSKPVLVFVPSRRQTRLTALDLISLSGGESNWVHMPDEELAAELENVSDDTLRHTLQFGIALHHAGLDASDRKISHRLFAEGKVQILCATSTLAWGVNLPAFLVVVKGTQFYDTKAGGYQDMSLTDVLQMMGRAGRPRYDTSGVAVVFTKESTKQFYKYFLNLGFPVESSLHKPNMLENHLGAEITGQRVKDRQDAIEFLRHTFLFQRVYANPAYYLPPEDAVDYEEQDVQNEKIEKWLFARINTACDELIKSGCLSSTQGINLYPTPYLKIVSFYYISHSTMRMFLTRLPLIADEKSLLQTLALASEFDELAIRHNEDLLNAELSASCPYPGEIFERNMVDPHVKAFLLVQARMHRLELPVVDYAQDTFGVVDQSIRILQAIIDTAVQCNLYQVIILAIKVLRALKQSVPMTSNMIKLLPGVSGNHNQLLLKDLDGSSAAKLRVANKHKSRFQRIVSSLPKVQIEGNKLVIDVKDRPVYCPDFYKPQRECWFVIQRVNGTVTSLERVQRNKVIEMSGEYTIMNDTVAIDYEWK